MTREDVRRAREVHGAEPLAGLAEDLRSGALPLSSYLDRLEARFAEREPGVLAVLPEAGRFERLRREGAALLARHPSPESRPPLFGVPIGVKDVFRAAGFPTRAGSRLPPELFAGDEAPSVAALKRAGALVLGKTVSTEFAYFAPGPTRNPRQPEHTPGGSSSGSAAAVAAGLCPLALGTQTIGSITRPAAYCGVVGFKPSYGRIPTVGVVPLAPSADHVGFFTADVAGARLAAALLCDGWRGSPRADGPVLGIPEGPYLGSASEEGSDHFRAVCARLGAAGFEVRPAPVLADFPDVVARHRRLVAAEAAAVHAPWFDCHRDLYDGRTAELVETGRSVSAPDLEDALAGRERLRAELSAAMDASGIDLWLSPPAQGPAPRGLGWTGDPIMNLPWTHAGVPTLALPAGEGADGLPMGLQLAARFGEDEKLLGWGALIDRELGRELAR